VIVKRARHKREIEASFTITNDFFNEGQLLKTDNAIENIILKIDDHWIKPFSDNSFQSHSFSELLNNGEVSFLSTCKVLNERDSVENVDYFNTEELTNMFTDKNMFCLHCSYFLEKDSNLNFETEMNLLLFNIKINKENKYIYRENNKIVQDIYWQYVERVDNEEYYRISEKIFDFVNLKEDRNILMSRKYFKEVHTSLVIPYSEETGYSDFLDNFRKI
jgi:hypothetical protein